METSGILAQPYPDNRCISIIAYLRPIAIARAFHLSRNSSTIRQYRPKVYADDDSLIGLKMKGASCASGQYAAYLLNAIVAVEDSRFYKHKGIDYLAIIRRAVKDVLHVGLKGAATQ